MALKESGRYAKGAKLQYGAHMSPWRFSCIPPREELQKHERYIGCIRKLRQLTCCLAALSGNDFKGSVFARRHLTKLISDRLLRQHNGLTIYNNIERDLVITKWISNYYNTDFSLEITPKVQKVSQKYTFTHKLTTKATFRRHLYFLAQPSRNGTYRIVGYQRQRRIHLCCLQKSIRRRYLMRQEVKLTLDTDIPWCLPTLKCILRRQHFSVFGCSHRQWLPLASATTSLRCAPGLLFEPISVNCS